MLMLFRAWFEEMVRPPPTDDSALMLMLFRAWFEEMVRPPPISSNAGKATVSRSVF